MRKLITLDPKKRLTAAQALNHNWVTGKAAKANHMEATQAKLKEFNARRKLKVGYRGNFVSFLMSHQANSGTSCCHFRASIGK